MTKIFPFGETSRKFWLTLALFAAAYLICAFFIIRKLADEEEAGIIYNFNDRARSLSWTLEGSARFFSRRSYPEQFLTEIARQPGVAWIAILDDNGRILLDSNAQVIGESLYTREEIENLAPEDYIKGRFSPDDPDVYEAFARFSPERLEKKPKSFSGAKYVFIGLDATDFKKSVDDYAGGLCAMAFLILLSLESLCALIFYFVNYSGSLRKLDDAKALGEQIIRNFPAALLAADSAGKIIFSNDSMRRLTGSPGSVYPGNIDDLEAVARFDWRGVLEKTQKGEALVEREKNIVVCDRAIPVSVSTSTLNDASGSRIGYLFVLRNLEALHILKEKLAESEKLSELGRLAAGLAHELRNPLSSIRGYARYLNKKLESDPMARATAELLEEESLRLNRVLSDLLAYAKPQKLNMSPVDLSLVAEKAVALTKMDADARGIQIEFKRPDSKTTARIDSDRLLQALINILLNAVQASSDGGRVRVGIERSENGVAPQWRLTIGDDGAGMDEETLGMIFEPYFSSRSGGTGLGLPMARQIVERHGGSISARSQPGRGSEFSILLPMEEDDKDTDSR